MRYVHANRGCSSCCNANVGIVSPTSLGALGHAARSAASTPTAERERKVAPPPRCLGRDELPPLHAAPESLRKRHRNVRRLSRSDVGLGLAA